MIDLALVFKSNNILFSIKTIAIYIGLFLVYYNFTQNNIRLILSGLLYVVCLYLFGINYKLGILYIVIAIAFVITESIYINFCDESWKYTNPDIIGIPYWLTFIWSIVTVIITEGVAIMKTFIV